MLLGFRQNIHRGAILFVLVAVVYSYNVQFDIRKILDDIFI